MFFGMCPIPSLSPSLATAKMSCIYNIMDIYNTGMITCEYVDYVVSNLKEREELRRDDLNQSQLSNHTYFSYKLSVRGEGSLNSNVKNIDTGGELSLLSLDALGRYIEATDFHKVCSIC